MKNHSLYSAVLVLLAIISLNACVTIQSNKATDFTTKIKDFYVVMDLAPFEINRQTKFEQFVKEDFDKRGIKYQFDPHNILSLETGEDVQTRIKNSKNEAIIVFGSDYEHKGKSSTLIYVVTIFTSGNPKPFWKGVITLNNNGALKGVVNTLFDKLIEDKMI